MTHRVATQAALVVASFAAGARSRAPSGSYVVVGLEEPYRSTEVFPDGRLIKAASQNKLADNGPPQFQLANSLIQAGNVDMSFPLDQLERLPAAR